MSNLVSVVIPAYNPPMMLFESCINSIINQSYQEIEVIVIDDGSNKESSSNLDRICKIDSRIKLYHQSNKGEGAARNAGIEKASGEYIIFVDADDCLGIDFLEFAVEKIVKYDADIVSGKVTMCEKPMTGNKPKSSNYSVIESKDIWKVQRDYLLERTDLLKTLDYLDMGACAKLIRKELMKGLKFPEGVKLSADQVFNHLLIEKCKKIVISDYPSYFYVMNFESVSHSYNSDAVQIMMHSLELVKNHLLSKQEILDAYYYHVIEDYQKALQFSVFNNIGRGSKFHFLKEELKKTSTHPLVQEAFANIKPYVYSSKTRYLKMKLLKNHIYSLYILLKASKKLMCR